MKTKIKISFTALAIAISMAACSGNNSTHVPDSTRVDSSQMDTGAGKNGSGAGIDSGMDNSSSGGTDTLKQGRKRKEFDR